MRFDPTRAAIRFGTGTSPRRPPPESAEAMLRALTGRDEMARRYPIAPYGETRPSQADWQAASQARRTARGTAQEATARAAFDALRAAATATARRNFAATLARGIAAPDGGLRERLVRFWADHFTVRGATPRARSFVTAYVEEAIRPRVAGRFGELLFAAATHPAMLEALDQTRSVGPGSPAGRRGAGLNENLARELLELHTVGADGPYGQADVRELAELLTGLGATARRGTTFRPERAEPGAETLLGTTFSGHASLDTVRAAMEMLARHPATARHLARKLAVHFVADDPDPALVAAIESAWRDSGGDLAAATAAMLGHPAAWDARARKVKPPYDFVQTALGALGVDPDAVVALDPREVRMRLERPLARMGQPWERPAGPDGWPEAGAAWITAPNLAARIDWAMTAPAALARPLPDPRAFARAAIGPDLPEAVAFAARAAESRAEAIGLVLASPAFQRR